MTSNSSNSTQLTLPGADWTIYPGHGAAGGVAVIDTRRRYITEFRAATQAQLGSSGLTSDGIKSIVAPVKARYPNWSLEILIPINAGAIAKELAKPTTP